LTGKSFGCYQLVEISEHDILKNFSFSSTKTPMKDLGIKDYKALYLYEIIRDMSKLEEERKLVNQHYYKKV
jgi:hypothetical protein